MKASEGSTRVYRSGAESGEVRVKSQYNCPDCIKRINDFVKNHFVEFVALVAAGALCYLDPLRFVQWFVIGAAFSFATDRYAQKAVNYLKELQKEQEESTQIQTEELATKEASVQAEEEPIETEEEKKARNQAAWDGYYQQKAFQVSISAIAVYCDFLVVMMATGGGVAAGNMAYWKVKEYMTPIPQ